MSLSDLKLGLMTFPQRWDGTQLQLRVLLLPSGDPLNQPLTASGPPFAGTQLHLQAVIIPDLDNLPSPSSAGAQSFHFNSIVPPVAVSLFNQLASTYNVVAPPSNPPPSNSVTWGQLLSFALREPQLAEALGLLYDVQLPIDPALVKNSGWIYVTLDESNPANPYITDWQANRDLIKRYAARLPALTSSRQVLAAVLFPVVDVLPNPGFYDEALIEAEEYDDGFTKIVHCSQPTSLDAATGDQNQLTPGTVSG